MEFKEYTLNELLPYEQPGAYIVESTDYNDAYKTPVLTAGKTFILGYTNETDGIFDRLPAIIFDDFTTASQYVNFKFKVKSSAMKILNINTELVLPKYIYYRMQVINIDHSTHKRYWIQQYSKIKIKVPPIPEQQRIVSKIEELFSSLDNAVETMNKTKEQLAVYRQAVLKEAFEGIDTCAYKEITSLCDNIVDCPHSTPKWVHNGKLCLRTTNFRRGYLDLSEKNYVSVETYNERITRLKPEPGDVLFSREGAILGLACIIPSGLEICMGQRMMLLRPSKEMNNRYLMHYLNSPISRQLIVENVGGSASPHINVGDIKRFKIPFVNRNKQEEIVSMVDARLSLCDSIEEMVDNALAKAEAMRQSILKVAFEGRMG